MAGTAHSAFERRLRSRVPCIPMSRFSRQVKQLLRLNDGELREVLQWVESAGGEGKGRHYRRSERLRLTIRRALLQVERADRPGILAFIVAPIDLSDSGIGFLHGSFLYPGTRCAISLRADDGTLLTAAGLVVRCRMVTGHVHDVGVRFEAQQRIESFVQRSEAQRDAA
jgi:hypothetical protein